MSLAQRGGVDRVYPSLSIARQCALLGVARSSMYHRPREASGEDLALMQALDRQYLETPFYGSRRMRVWLAGEGRCVSWKRVQRLMRIMGLRAIYPSPRPAGRRRSTGYIPDCWPRSGLPGTTRRGPPTSPTCPWPVDSSTWWPSWTGTAGTWWSGDCPTAWRPTSASTP